MLDTEKEKHMKQLKKKMECWREIILPLNSILLWEEPWYPALIVGTASTVFLLIWLMEPAFLTIVSMSLLILALIDYLVPIMISTFIPSNSWNGQKERKFDEICQRVSETILHAKGIWKSMLSARNNRPNIYYGSTTVCLSLLAWLGNIVNNLLLIYLICKYCKSLCGSAREPFSFTWVIALLLLPGLRHKGRAQSSIKEAYNYLVHRKQA